MCWKHIQHIPTISSLISHPVQLALHMREQKWEQGKHLTYEQEKKDTARGMKNDNENYHMHGFDIARLPFLFLLLCLLSRVYIWMRMGTTHMEARKAEHAAHFVLCLAFAEASNRPYKCIKYIYANLILALPNINPLFVSSSKFWRVKRKNRGIDVFPVNSEKNFFFVFFQDKLVPYCITFQSYKYAGTGSHYCRQKKDWKKNFRSTYNITRLTHVYKPFIFLYIISIP